ncbi:MAG: hypothetical protein KBH99_07655 [Syntrophobacteraceae bacterium]|nr:hypothetical protein [Syntrophobacteraceae bacterium]
MGFWETIKKVAETLDTINKTLEPILGDVSRVKTRINEMKMWREEFRAQETERENNLPENRARAAARRRELSMIALAENTMSGEAFMKQVKEDEDDLMYYDHVLKEPIRTLPDICYRNVDKLDKPSTKKKNHNSK